MDMFKSKLTGPSPTTKPPASTPTHNPTTNTATPVKKPVSQGSPMKSASTPKMTTSAKPQPSASLIDIDVPNTPSKAQLNTTFTGIFIPKQQQTKEKI